MGAEIISVVNQKGGTGKTTTTMNLGAALAGEGKRVLMIDLDPQANLTYALGLDQAEPTIVDLISEECTLEGAVRQCFGADIIPGSANMADVAIALATLEQREFFLSDCLKSAVDKYDYILIDAPPSLSLLTVNALTASDSVIIPMQLEVLAIQGLNQVYETVVRIKKAYNPRLQIKGILFVMYNRRRKSSLEIKDLLAENLTHTRTFKSRIRQSSKISEAPSFGMPVIQYDPASEGSRDYVALAKELLALNGSPLGGDSAVNRVSTQ